MSEGKDSIFFYATDNRIPRNERRNELRKEFNAKDATIDALQKKIIHCDS